MAFVHIAYRSINIVRVTFVTFIRANLKRTTVENERGQSDVTVEYECVARHVGKLSMHVKPKYAKNCFRNICIFFAHVRLIVKVIHFHLNGSLVFTSSLITFSK